MDELPMRSFASFILVSVSIQTHWRLISMLAFLRVPGILKTAIY
jgi:hypothetical protein